MRFFVPLLFIALFLSGCGLREREKELERRTLEINEKEQALLMKEKSLQVKEEELLNKERLLDSTRTLSDSFALRHPQLAGKWNVTMRCTETTCAGSAVGDTKIEQWEISYQNNGIFITAYSGDKIVRVYSGSYNGNAVELSTAPDNADPAKSTKMVVRLQEIKENEIKGERQITRPDNCHIIYSLDLKKL